MPKRIPPLTRIGGVASVLTLAVIAGTAGVLIGRYPCLTPYLPVHFGRGGIADRGQAQSWSLVLMPLWVQLALALVFGTVVLILLWRAEPARADERIAQARARPMLSAAEGITLLALDWIAFQEFSAV